MPSYVRKGQAFRARASDWNEFVDAARWVKGRALRTGAIVERKRHGPSVATCTFLGTGAALAVNAEAWLEVPFACRISAARVVADQSATASVDVRLVAFADVPADSGDSIVSLTPPALSAAQSSEDTALSGWTTDVSAGDWLYFVLTANDNATRLAVSLTLDARM